jgi:peptide/nickel transport system permease protein
VKGKILSAKKYIRRNPSLGLGIVLLLAVLLFCGIGSIFVPASRAYPLSVPASRPISRELPLGSDRQGRDILAVMIAGTPLTLKIGLIAGAIGTVIGTMLGFVSAYYRGVPDTFIRGMVDVLLTIPSIMVLILIAVSLRQAMTVNGMALVVSILAWVWPTRTIRAQVLTMRESGYIRVAQLSGMSGPEIIVKEMIPNLLPYLGASFVGAVASAILASIGIEALGLGPMEAPTLGMTIYWVLYYAALIHGMWWWWAPPIIIIIVVFVGLFLLSAGLDELANPRVRRVV